MPARVLQLHVLQHGQFFLERGLRLNRSSCRPPLDDATDARLYFGSAIRSLHIVNDVVYYRQDLIQCLEAVRLPVGAEALPGRRGSNERYLR